MILAIDVGNTNVVMGFIEGDTIVDKYRLSTNSNETAEEYAIKLHSVLDLMHLEPSALEDKAKVYPDTLSGGEQQRVAVARALAHSPKLVIADEPTGNIDPELSLEMMELLERVSQTGITVLVVTHEHELVHRFHQRVVTLKNGRIISDIPADPEAIAARSAELNAWKELTEPVDDEPDEQNDETKEKEAATV